MSAVDALAVIDRLGGMPGMLQHADQDDRAAFYATLGVSATYDPNDPDRRARRLPYRVAQKTCRRGDLNPHAPKGTSPSS